MFRCAVHKHTFPPFVGPSRYSFRMNMEQMFIFEFCVSAYLVVHKLITTMPEDMLHTSIAPNCQKIRTQWLDICTLAFIHACVSECVCVCLFFGALFSSSLHTKIELQSNGKLQSLNCSEPNLDIRTAQRE